MEMNLKAGMRMAIVCTLCILMASSCEKNNEESTVTDIDGNVYSTVTIGTQVWLGENLKTTTYNDGSDILNSPSTAGSYLIYGNNPDNKDTYGALYNWYAVNTGKLCPTGWHVPTDA